MSRFGSVGTQYFTDDNEVLGGGKLYFYNTGTSTPKTTYSNVGLTIANTNPVVLDADGRQPDIFFDGVAKAVLTDSSGTVIDTKDPVGETSQLAFQLWQTERVYDKYEVVTGSDGYFYVSREDGNSANDPTLSPTKWKLLTEYIGFESANDGYVWTVDSTADQTVAAVHPKTVGGLILLSSATASNSATIDFTGIDGTYDEYVISLMYVIPETDNTTLYLRTSSDGGSTFDSAGSNYRYLIAGQADAGQIPITQSSTGNVDAVTEPGVCAVIHLFDPDNTTTSKHFLWTYSNVDTVSNFDVGTGMGHRRAASIVNAVRFFFSSGNIASGIFHLYGVRKT